VQAAITAAGRSLPQSLSLPPYYKKVNPADAPITFAAQSDATIKVLKSSHAYGGRSVFGWEQPPTDGPRRKLPA
jgi:hypothetical protein